MKLLVSISVVLSVMLSLAVNIPGARADDVAEFNLMVQRYNDSLSHWDADRIADIEAEAFGFTSTLRYITQNKLVDKELWKSQLRELISQYEYYDIEIVTSQTNVIGNTGIACGSFKVSRKHREYPWVSASKRWSTTWVKSEGEWKLVFYHFELIEAWR
ncbi:MAG: nuclear transport factor 2 family protein [Deltaproteobacteria bacterium]|jgi:ketosteroid isomerase-like protein|nr:nuclear transport factor 2 family protein [Deltaproteobacteria bacterium]MBW2515505.1 nuclear transport factor 2 family protein [Deltaproteobacteria bacterium]